MMQVGSFRVTSSDLALRELEIHMSQGNNAYLAKIENANLVANHLKRIFREMAEPLFPEELYDDFCESAGIEDGEEKVDKILTLLQKIR